MKFTHDQLQEDLASHLRGNTDRMVWTNTQLGPSGSPRPDVFTVDKSYARFSCDAYEIKISVSDLRRDVTSGKWQSYREFSHRVWFAIPQGLVPLDEIPRECGVIVRYENVWRAARKPIAKSLDTMPRNAWLKLLIEAFPNSPHLKPRQTTRNEYQARQAVLKKLGQDASALFNKRETARSSYECATQQMQTAADDIYAEIKRMRDNARQRVENEEYRLNEAQRHLAEALGIPSDQMSAQTLIERLNSLRWKLRGGHLNQTIDQLTALRGILRVDEDA